MTVISVFMNALEVMENDLSISYVVSRYCESGRRGTKTDMLIVCAYEFKRKEFATKTII